MKNVLIIGITGALGKSLERELKNNFRVFGISRSKNNKKNHLSLDLSKDKISKSAKLFFKKNKFDYIINTAGLYSSKEILNSDLNEIKKIFDVNFFSIIKIIHLINNYNNFYDLSFININSVAGLEFPKNECIYACSKHALRVFSEIFSFEASKNRVELINFYPSAFKSNITKKRSNYDKLMNPDDIANLIIENIFLNNKKNLRIKSLVFTRNFMLN